MQKTVEKFPRNFKFWIIKSELETDNDTVRKNFEMALQVPELKKCSVLWIAAANFEILQAALTKARTILQKARLKISNSEDLWFESINLEIISGNLKIAQTLSS